MNGGESDSEHTQGGSGIDSATDTDTESQVSTRSAEKNRKKKEKKKAAKAASKVAAHIRATAAEAAEVRPRRHRLSRRRLRASTQPFSAACAGLAAPHPRLPLPLARQEEEASTARSAEATITTLSLPTICNNKECLEDHADLEEV